MTQYIGISSDEAYRMKDAREKYITNVYPLAMSGWDRSRCMEYMARRWPEIPVSRSACYFCPFHSPGEWTHIAENAPDLFEKACRMDEAMHVMPSGPLRPGQGPPAPGTGRGDEDAGQAGPGRRERPRRRVRGTLLRVDSDQWSVAGSKYPAAGRRNDDEDQHGSVPGLRNNPLCRRRDRA